jgi:hypothetical protein
MMDKQIDLPDFEKLYFEHKTNTAYYISTKNNQITFTTFEDTSGDQNDFQTGPNGNEIVNIGFSINLVSKAYCFVVNGVEIFSGVITNDLPSTFDKLDLGQYEGTEYIGKDGIIGLMFRTKINGLYSFPLSSIDKTLHTFFCFCPMDAVCLSKYGRVLEVIKMRPWNYYLCHKDTVDVIEGPVGAFDYMQEGDLVKF